MAEIAKRKLVGKASDYFEDQLADLDIISAKIGISRAQLLREGADLMINKHKKYLPKKS
jgi:hypothetical protein